MESPSSSALANVRGWQVGAFENLGVGQSGCRLTGGELLTQRFRLRARTHPVSATIRAIFCHRFLLHVSKLAFPYSSR